jgi:hypothetical protein
MSVVLSGLFVAALALAPVMWRLWRDRRDERALAVRATVDAAVRQALHGESLVAVEVKAPTALRGGRVILTVPRAWDWLVREAWTSVIEHIPHGYELVVRGGGRQSLAPTTEPEQSLPRAA